MSNFRIIKFGGHCYDGCGWVECSFWDRSSIQGKCLLFGGIEGKGLDHSKSLPECDIIFGLNCEKDIDTTTPDSHVVALRTEKFKGEWVVVIGFNDRTVIAHDKDMTKAALKAKELGYPLVTRVGETCNSGIMIYIPGSDETMIGGRYYKKNVE